MNKRAGTSLVFTALATLAFILSETPPARAAPDVPDLGATTNAAVALQPQAPPSAASDGTLPTGAAAPGLPPTGAAVAAPSAAPPAGTETPSTAPSSAADAQPAPPTSAPQPSPTAASPSPSTPASSEPTTPAEPSPLAPAASAPATSPVGAPVERAAPATSNGQEPLTRTQTPSTFAFGAQLGTFGFGGQVAAAIVPRILDLRTDIGTFGFGINGTSNGFSYNGKLHLETTDVGLDIHPFPNPFRLSAGVTFGSNRIDITGVPNGARTFYLNGHPYSAEDIGDVLGTATFGTGANPFVSIGYGTAFGPRNAIGLTADVGVLLQPAAVVSISTTRNELPPAAQAQFVSDLLQAKLQLQNNLTIVRTFPVARIGLRFQL